MHIRQLTSLALVLLSLTIFANRLVTGSSSAAEPQLGISALAFEELPLVPPTAQEIAEAATAEGWCRATPTGASKAWNVVPQGADHDHWISVVTVGINEQAHAYAFSFDGPEEQLSLVAHLPFRRVWKPNNTRVWEYPLDTMLGSLRVYQTVERPAVERRPLALRVVPWKESGERTLQPTEETNLEEASAQDPAVTLAAAEIMAYAAAFEAGWSPTAVKSDWSAECQVRIEDRSCSYRITVTGPDYNRVFTKERVDWESYHETLARMFRVLRPESGISDFVRLAQSDLKLVAADEQHLACLVKDKPISFDLRTGESASTALAPADKQSTASDQRFKLSTDAESLICVDRVKSKEQWRVDVGDVLLQAPIVFGDQILVATKGNQLLVLDAAKGDVLQRKQWPTWLVDVCLMNTPAGAMLACADLEGTVTTLALPKLTQVESIQLGAELKRPLLYVAKAPLTWPKPSDPQEQENLVTEIGEQATALGPAIFTADSSGFLYILPLDTTKK